MVIEAQRVGWGAAGRNSGFMIDLPHELNSENYAGSNSHDVQRIRANRMAMAFAAEAAAEYGLHDCLDRCGKYHGAATPHGLAALRDFERHLATLGEACSALGARQMKAVTGTDFYRGGTFTPGAVMIQPAAYVRGVAGGLSRRVALFEDSPVVSIETGRDHVLRTPEGQVTTPRLLLTVNGHIESFGFFRRRLMHVFTYASMTRQLDEAEIRRLGGEPAWGLIPAEPMGSTIRRIRDNRIVVRNTFTWNPAMATSEAQVARAGARHDRSFRARFPMLKEVGMAYRWGGHLCLSLNSAPAFGEIAERVFAACCCNGLGTVQGTLYGKLAAELATGEAGAGNRDVANIPEPTLIYPEPLMTIGATVRLWWMQHRAGAEL